MPDVFISYSRDDVDFVHDLNDGLVARGKDVWVDFEDIPLTAAWLEQVFQGIESSDNFLFVLSPDSLTSDVCTQELDHALEHRKRLVPVLRRAVDDGAVPAALGARNWTFFREHDDFDRALDALVEALDTDLEWVGAHTRLLGRAREWDREGREGSYLLRGRDLDEAERWIAAETPDREPQPTPLQREYLHAGRRAATRRQRIVVGASLLAVLVALSLAVLALLQRNEARREARVALSRQLAAQSAAARDIDPQRSLALAARAATTSETDEAEDALRRSLRAALGRSVLPVSKARVWSARFSANGKRLVTASQDGIARVWDGTRPVVSLRSGAPLFDARPAAGGLVVTAGDRGAQLWRAGADRPLASFGRNANAAAVSPNGRVLAGAGDAGLQLWTIATRRPLGAALDGQFSAVDFDAGGTRLVAAAGSTATVWALPSRRRVARLRHPAGVQVRDAVFSPDGARVATAGDDGIVRVWNVPSGRGAFELAGHEEALQGLTFSPDGSFLVTTADDATGRVWDLRRRRVTGELLGHTGSVLGASFRPDGRLIATAGADGTVRLWAPPNQALVELEIPNRAPVRDIRFSPDGTMLVTASEDGTARVWKGRSAVRLQHGRENEPDDWVESAAFGRDGRTVVTAGDDGTAKVWNPRLPRPKPLATLGTLDGPPLRAVDLSPRDDAVAVSGQDGAVRLWLWRRRDGEGVRLLGRQDERVEGVAFAPDGATVASAGWDGTARLWSLDGRQLAGLRGDGERLSSVAFSPDGKRVAAGGWSGSTWIWDAKTQRLSATLSGRALVSAVSFSRDGEFVATAGDDGAARVYSADTGRLVALLPTRAASLEAVQFSPVGARLAVAGDGGLAAVLDCLECRPLDELLCLAGRRLGDAAPAAIDTHSGRCHSR